MEVLLILVPMAALIALLGRNRSIGYGWSFAFCLFLSPIIGLIIILCSKKVPKKDVVDFVEMKKENDLN